MASTEVLKINSNRAQDCAQLFLRFKDHLPANSEAAVTSVVTDLYALSRALLDLRKSVDDPRNDAYVDTIEKDQDTTSRSVTHTLRDLQRHTNLIEELRERGLEDSEKAKEAHKVAWKKVANYFADEGDRIRGCETLSERLESYVNLLKDLRKKLEGDTPSREFRDLRYRVEKLLQKQEKAFDDLIGVSRLSLGPDVPKFEKQKSWERKRPARTARPEREHRDPRDPRRPGSRTEGRRPGSDKRRSSRQRYDSDHDLADLVDSTSDEPDFEFIGKGGGMGPIVGYDYDDDDFDRPDVIQPQYAAGRRPGTKPLNHMASPNSPHGFGAPSMGYFQPMAPEPPYPAAPGFGAGSSSAATPSTLSSETDSSQADHWLPIVFGLSRPTTSFKSTGSDSGVFGDHDPGCVSHLRDHYEQILKFPFEDAHVDLRIFLKDEDYRAKILVRQDRGKRSIIACEAAANLRIIRHESCLQLCLPAKPDRRDRRDPRADPRGKVFLWTMLRFLTYERMIVFWCSFHALKAQDEYAKLDKLEDTILDGEVCLFQGVIDDDSYQHALHLLRDRDSGGMRLQASALSGQMKRCPIWTAFITYQVESRSWARRVESRKIHLQELTRYVFTSADLYEPPTGPNGQHEIKFSSSTEARKFIETLQDIADGKMP